MSHVLAAIDDAAATAPVVAVAQWFAGLLDVEVVALHVSEDGSGTTARATAAAVGVKFEVRDGVPSRPIRRAASDDDVLGIAIGARGLPADRVPAGHVALDMIRRVEKPVIVVPPDARPRRRSTVATPCTGRRRAPDRRCTTAIAQRATDIRP